jgi:GH25 family lysozyme M1 (1,4-beta-N-acetylmuramidase)
MIAMNLKAIKAISIAMVGILSFSSISPLTTTAVNVNTIDTYYESKLDLLQGNNSSIFEVLENKKALFNEQEEETVTTTEPSVTEPDTTEETTTDTDTILGEAEPIVIVSESKVLYYGIDVSKWQGTINWEKVKNSGVDFAIIRAGYTSSSGTYCKDQYFEYNYEQCKKYGIPVGCYYYTRATSVSKSVSEAEYLLDLMEGKSFEYPVCFDIEDSSLTSSSRTALTNVTMAFCNTVESEGYYVSIYANPNWFDNILYTDQLTAYDKWLAHWTTTPKYGNEFGGLWQKGVGTCAGISGECDIDRSYRNYSSIIANAHLNGC